MKDAVACTQEQRRSEHQGIHFILMIPPMYLRFTYLIPDQGMFLYRLFIPLHVS